MERSLIRIQSVDIFRLIAIFAVILIHSTPFHADVRIDDKIYKYLDIIINQTARFAVPFFFVISGYFWGVKTRRGDNPISTANVMAKRIGIIFLAWCCIYMLPYNLASIYEYGVLGPIKMTYWNLTNLAKEPVLFLMQGTKVHLWFLIGLLFSLYISAFFINKRLTKSLLAISVVLYVIGVMGKAYGNTPMGMEISFNTRNGPFFGLLLFVSGFIISGFKSRPNWLKNGFLLAGFGLVLHFSELYFLWKYYGANIRQDYVIGTYFMGVGVAIASLSDHDFFQNLPPSLCAIGKMTLGIYVIHFIFIDLLHVIDKNIDSPLWEIGHPFLVFGLSVISVVLLSKNQRVKQIII